MHDSNEFAPNGPFDCLLGAPVHQTAVMPDPALHVEFMPSTIRPEVSIHLHKLDADIMPDDSVSSVGSAATGMTAFEKLNSQRALLQTKLLNKREGRRELIVGRPSSLHPGKFAQRAVHSHNSSDRCNIGSGSSSGTDQGGVHVRGTEAAPVSVASSNTSAGDGRGRPPGGLPGDTARDGRHGRHLVHAADARGPAGHVARPGRCPAYGGEPLLKKLRWGFFIGGLQCSNHCNFHVIII